jgi:hypothetical protein
LADFGIQCAIRRLQVALEGSDEAVAQAGDVEAGEVGGAGDAGGDLHR